MILLYKYILAHYKTVSFFVALVFFLMDMSGFVGIIGYQLYYPMLFFMSYYCLKNNNKIGLNYILFLMACLLSIIVNTIPSYYNAPIRWCVFVLLLLSFSNLANSRKIALMRLHLFHIFSILSVVIVVFSFLFLVLGLVNIEQMDLYIERGIYTGGTANNEMGILGAMSILFISVFLYKHFSILKLWEKAVLFGCLYCGISMMALASSRMGLICTLVSIMFAFYRMNRKKLSKLIATICIFVIGVSFVSNYMSEKFTFMLDKNKGQIERIDIDSREEMWQSRMDEFSESPIFGVGFAYMKYGWGQGMASTQSGRIESGSGWLSVLSQTGLLGGVCLLAVVMPCIFFLFRNKSDSYVNAWYSGMCMLFILQPITEAYITTVGALLGCLFWLNYSVIDSFRIGLLKDEDLDLRSYLYNSSKVNN